MRPPRISSVCPGCASRPTVSEPWAVWTISGIAPSVAQSSSERNGVTWVAGTLGELGIAAVFLVMSMVFSRSSR
jgi:hypothetical protein